MNYLLEQHKITTNIELTMETMNNRLIASFGSLEAEADKLTDEIPSNNEEQYVDDVWYARERHLSINYAIKQELIKNACVWLFHIFEKDCERVFKRNKN